MVEKSIYYNAFQRRAEQYQDNIYIYILWHIHDGQLNFLVKIRVLSDTKYCKNFDGIVTTFPWDATCITKALNRDYSVPY